MYSWEIILHYHNIHLLICPSLTNPALQAVIHSRRLLGWVIMVQTEIGIQCSKGQSHWLYPLIPTIIPSTQDNWECIDWNKPLLSVSPVWAPCLSPSTLPLILVIHSRPLPPHPRYSPWFSINSSLLVFISFFPVVFAFLFLSLFFLSAILSFSGQ